MPVDFIVDDLAWAQPPFARVCRAPLFDGDIAGLDDGACRHKASGGVLSGRPRNAYTAVQLRRLRSDRSALNPNGPYLVSMVGVDRLTNWADRDADGKRMRRERWMDRIIGDLDSYFPGIAGAVVQREMSTAETFHYYLNTPEGAIYGFAPQTRGFMPLAKTAIGGLYLASAFTGGGGYTGAILGGGWAARAAIGARPD